MSGMVKCLHQGGKIEIGFGSSCFVYVGTMFGDSIISAKLSGFGKIENKPVMPLEIINHLICPRRLLHNLSFTLPEQRACIKVKWSLFW